MAAEEGSERQPLLKSQSEKNGDGHSSNYTEVLYPGYSSGGNQLQQQPQLQSRIVSASGETSAVATIGPDELPPSYTSAVSAGTGQPGGAGVPMITCRVCQAMIDITGKREQHVVKCGQCFEATPIRNAPPGKKYVRCPCHCLLICKMSSQRIACPRPNCKRIINLAPSPVTPPCLPSMTGMDQINCGHCNNTFLFNMLHNTLARCPHCRKVSSVGPHFARGRAILYSILTIIVLALAIGVTLGTIRIALNSTAGGGYFVLYVGGFLIAIFLLFKTVYYYRMKVSDVVA